MANTIEPRNYALMQRAIIQNAGLPALRCVVFDLDGTLVDLGDMFYRIFSELIRTQGLAPIQFDRHGDPWVSAHGQALAAYPQLCGVTAEPWFADTWEQVVREMLATGEVRLYTGARAMLEQVRESGRRICLASNTPKRFVAIKLEVLGIAHFFDAVFTPQDQWGAKPKPASLFHAMKKFGLAPREIVMVGDHDQDVLYGKNAGVRTVALTGGYGSPEELRAAQPDFLLASIAGFPSVLARLDLRPQVP